jgi:uncharacterized protein YacL
MTDPNQPYGTTPPAYQQAPAYSAAQGYNGYGQPASERYNVLAIVSLVSAFFVSLAAVITGHIALTQIKRTGEKGRGLAIAGLVLGYLGLISGLIAGVIFFLLFASSPGVFTTPS